MENVFHTYYYGKVLNLNIDDLCDALDIMREMQGCSSSKIVGGRGGGVGWGKALKKCRP